MEGQASILLDLEKMYYSILLLVNRGNEELCILMLGERTLLTKKKYTIAL